MKGFWFEHGYHWGSKEMQSICDGLHIQSKFFHHVENVLQVCFIRSNLGLYKNWKILSVRCGINQGTIFWYTKIVYFVDKYLPSMWYSRDFMTHPFYGWGSSSFLEEIAWWVELPIMHMVPDWDRDRKGDWTKKIDKEGVRRESDERKKWREREKVASLSLGRAQWAVHCRHYKAGQLARWKNGQ